jgi:hypothetical protein
MRSASLLSVALIAAVEVDALSLHQRDVPAVVGYNIERRDIKGFLQKRASTVDVLSEGNDDEFVLRHLADKNSAYFANCR